MASKKHKLGKRRALARILRRSGILTLTRPLAGGRLTIFNYHRISPSANPTPLFDGSVFGPDPESFREQLRWMKTDADPVTESDLLAFVRKKAPLPKRSFLVTFDDGYRDNYELALPVLREQGVPAIFFIPTQLIEERRVGWWDVVYWFLRNTRKEAIEIRGERLSTGRPLLELAELFNQKMKLGAAPETATLVEELSRACDVPPPAREVMELELMTWDQIRDAHRQGIGIGSHTHSHRVLACLDVETQLWELSESKRILEERLGAPVPSIAYPVGGYEHVNRETLRLARDCGYELGFTFLTGSNRVDAMDPFDIRRLDRQLDEPTTSAVLSMPWIFAKRTCLLPAPGTCRHSAEAARHSQGATT